MAKGMAPMMAAAVVIMMGRKRTRLASKIASGAALPFRPSSIAKSIIMMAFFLTMPMSIIKPTKP
ncbi:hypothetical protein D3C72_2547960 [compost metagenome]